MSTSSNQPRIALALAGGGPLGAIYEIGALCALEDSLQGIAFNRLHHYVGVSAGGFIAASLANGFTPRELCTSFIENSAASEVFDPAWLMVPAYGEFGRRLARLPRLAASALWRATGGRKPLTHALEQLGPALPTGIFSSEEIHRRLAEAFSRPGRTNDFRRLPTRLTLVATNLDTGKAAPFGRPGFDDVPISRAVQASAALPGLFPPVRIGDADFVDGALEKTLHASVALDEGVDLMLCINPLVPFNAGAAARAGERGIPRIVEGGLPAVLSQTFRSMIHSRMALGMKHYERSYPGTDIVLIEPDRRDPELYLANTFSYRQRRQLAEHAYQQTRALLRERRAEIAPKLARHGVRLRDDRLQDDRRLLAPPQRPARLGQAMATLNGTLDDLGRLVQGAGQAAA
ncbi:patatin-like phospholipase family protein [Ramlibacter tataouinensis]|uniref:patatin-like phospholipase family protein n=1 Tax=Ramlibacter tataouinensis TaxID=94132 RepID=UPI0022F3EA76|nr:patatin-like phospholipase family protein [Ramlibacter tataouinensis]WBY00699.1 patatin-like phospholipase family protein [Ramlibacter tataouinensis]